MSLCVVCILQFFQPSPNFAQYVQDNKGEKLTWIIIFKDNITSQCIIMIMALLYKIGSFKRPEFIKWIKHRVTGRRQCQYLTLTGMQTGLHHMRA